MRWTHLPVAGGIYDQHPKLMDDFMVVMGVVSHVEKQKAEQERMNARRPTGMR